MILTAFDNRPEIYRLSREAKFFVVFGDVCILLVKNDFGFFFSFIFLKLRRGLGIAGWIITLHQHGINHLVANNNLYKHIMYVTPCDVIIIIKLDDEVGWEKHWGRKPSPCKCEVYIIWYTHTTELAVADGTK